MDLYLKHKGLMILIYFIVNIHQDLVIISHKKEDQLLI